MRTKIPGRPPSLSHLQGWLRWIFTDPRGPEKALGPARAANGGLRRLSEPPPRLLDWIEDGPPIGRVRRLSVYSDAYFLRLLDSLGADFKTVRRALGEETFRVLIAGYLAATPSASANIGDLGEGLPDFAGAHALARRFPFLGDLARLERKTLGMIQGGLTLGEMCARLEGDSPDIRAWLSRWVGEGVVKRVDFPA